MKGPLNWLLVVTAALAAHPFELSTCPTDIPEHQRQDCYPETGASPEGCAARGCLWCPAHVQGNPYCFFTNTTAPKCSYLPDHAKSDCYPEPGATEAGCRARNCCWASSSSPGTPWCYHSSHECALIPTADRIDCHPESGASSSLCRARGCLWCETIKKNVPYCFYDSNQNSASCSNNIPVLGRIDCHPQPGSTKEKCEAKGCLWCATNQPNAPWCFFQDDGKDEYSMAGDPGKIARGWRVVLTKKNSKSLFGKAISPIAMDVEFHSNKRLRFKIYDPNNQRFEVPLNIESPRIEAADPDYDIEFEKSPFFHFKIRRRGTGTVL